MASASVKRQDSRNNQNPFIYTLDVLTDGSEGTGDGTLFLSVWKRAKLPVNLKDPQTIEQLASGVPVARYAVTGLGDLTSRLATDQRFKLQTVKAVFCCSTPAGLWGLPALLIALHQAGAAELAIVSTQSDKVAKAIDLLESTRQNPVVHLCQVPEKASSDAWWQVYRDAYLLVHAKRWKQNTSCQESVIYLYTLLKYERANSILLLPPKCEPCDQLTTQLPIIDDKNPAQLLLGVSLMRCNGPSISSVRNERFNWYFTMPFDSCLDSGLLVRAQQQSRLWNKQSRAFFPWNCARESSTPTHDRRLCSNTSLVLSDDATGILASLNRGQLFRSEACESERGTWPSLLHDFFAGSSSESPVDDNEIVLDEENEIESSQVLDSLPSAPAHLLVLGTGCASPSPYRGASGYALFLQNDLTIAIEAGEGFVTQWNRYVSGRSLSTIRMIWISHAHWDHYGGLASLLVAIQNDRRTNRNAAQPSKKRLRSENIPPWVMAPRKVLKYLELVLGEPAPLFRAVPHENASAVPKVFDDLNKLTGFHERTIVFWENVPVEHSCRSAYGFVMGLHAVTGPPLVFSFSGDTLPCRRFVQACRKLSAIHSAGRINFLLHEATFDDNEKQMSIEKKHCTVLEAMQVGKDVCAERVLLTHFSQRYDSVPAIDPSFRHCAGFALDGMLVPLRH